MQVEIHPVRSSGVLQLTLPAPLAQNGSADISKACSDFSTGKLGHTQKL